MSCLDEVGIIQYEQNLEQMSAHPPYRAQTLGRKAHPGPKPWAEKRTLTVGKEQREQRDQREREQDKILGAKSLFSKSHNFGPKSNFDTL